MTARWSPAAPGSSGRRWSTGCSPKATRSTSSTTCRPGRSPTSPTARADASNQLTFHQIDIREPGAGRRSSRAGSPRSSSTSRPRPTCGCRSPAGVRRRGQRRSAASTSSKGRGAAGARKVVFASSGGTIYGDPDPSSCRSTSRTRSSRSRPTAWPRRSSATTSTPTASCTSSSTPRWRWPTCTGRARTRTARPGWWPSSPATCSAGEPCTIFGDGEQTRDFVFVDDVVDAFVRAARQRAAGCSLNIGTGVETSVNQLYRRWPTPPASTRRRCRRRRARASCALGARPRPGRASTSAGSRGRPRRGRRRGPAGSQRRVLSSRAEAVTAGGRRVM